MKYKFVKITFGGDLMCLQEQNQAIMKKYGKYYYNDALSSLSELFDDSDYTIANLETPISDDQLSAEQICFNTPPNFLKAIKDCGIDFLSTANNHCLDRGIYGLKDTIAYLDKYGIEHSGTYLTKESSDSIFYKEINGLRIAIICCTFGTNSEHNGVVLKSDETWMVDLLKRQNKKSRIASRTTSDRMIYRMIPDNVSIAAINNTANIPYVQRILDKVIEAKQHSDIVIAIPHIGGQYNPAPGTYTKYIVNQLTKAGCNLVIAGHPHVPLRTDVVNGVFTIYSLGNLSFTPDVGYYLPNVLSEYGIVLHTIWNVNTKSLYKVTFNVVKNIVKEDGVSYAMPVHNLYQECANAIERDCLLIDNEAIVNRICGTRDDITMEKEYTIVSHQLLHHN